MEAFHTDVQPPRTASPARRRWPAATAAQRQVSPSLLVVAVVGLSALVAALVLIASGATEQPSGRAALQLLVVGAPVLTALFAVEHPRTERFGRLLLFSALLWALTGLAQSSAGLAYSTGRVVAWLTFPVLLYLMLTFPDGRLPTTRDRRLIQAATLLIAGLYVGSAPIVEAYPAPSPWASCATDCPPNAFLLLSSEPGFVEAVLVPVREGLSLLVLLGVTASLLLRLRGASTIRHVTIAPVVAVSVLSSLVLAAAMLARRTAPDSALVEPLGLAWTLCLPAIAAGFSLGLLQRRLLISSVLSALSGALNAELEPGQVGAALRSTLGDPEAQVLVRDREGARWVREDGRTAEPSQVPPPGRDLRAIGDASGPFAAVELGPLPDADEEVVEAIVGLGNAAFREARLKEDLEASLTDLDESRQRIATAADAERRRIERDLHDGAQQRLIALRMRLSLAEDLLHEDPEAASEAIHRIGEDVDVALDEIRALAQGIYPALLADRGLADALRSAARRAPSRVEVEATGLGRHPPEIESAVYFSCLEALQNVVKHGRGATSARVVLRQNGTLTFEVGDDGQGFDPARAPAGAGMRNMRDRVESLGGTLTVLSSPGHGTIVRGAIPLVRHEGSGRGRFRRVPPAVEHGAQEAERQRQPVGEDPVGERREHRIGG